jgi:hypothetical protein
MKMKNITALTIIAIFAAPVLSQTNSEYQKPPDWDNYQAQTQRDAQAAQHEQMRDHSHDSRLPAGPNTSLGVDPSKGQVNVRRTY